MDLLPLFWVRAVAMTLMILAITSSFTTHTTTTTRTSLIAPVRGAEQMPGNSIASNPSSNDNSAATNSSESSSVPAPSRSDSIPICSSDHSPGEWFSNYQYAVTVDNDSHNSSLPPNKSFNTTKFVVELLDAAQYPYNPYFNACQYKPNGYDPLTSNFPIFLISYDNGTNRSAEYDWVLQQACVLYIDEQTGSKSEKYHSLLSKLSYVSAFSLTRLSDCKLTGANVGSRDVDHSLTLEIGYNARNESRASFPLRDTVLRDRTDLNLNFTSPNGIAGRIAGDSVGTNVSLVAADPSQRQYLITFTGPSRVENYNKISTYSNASLNHLFGASYVKLHNSTQNTSQGNTSQDNTSEPNPPEPTLEHPPAPTSPNTSLLPPVHINPDIEDSGIFVFTMPRGSDAILKVPLRLQQFFNFPSPPDIAVANRTDSDTAPFQTYFVKFRGPTMDEYVRALKSAIADPTEKLALEARTEAINITYTPPEQKKHLLVILASVFTAVVLLAAVATGICMAKGRRGKRKPKSKEGGANTDQEEEKEETHRHHRAGSTEIEENNSGMRDDDAVLPLAERSLMGDNGTTTATAPSTTTSQYGYGAVPESASSQSQGAHRHVDLSSLRHADETTAEKGKRGGEPKLRGSFWEDNMCNVNRDGTSSEEGEQDGFFRLADAKKRPAVAAPGVGGLQWSRQNDVYDILDGIQQHSDLRPPLKKNVVVKYLNKFLSSASAPPELVAAYSALDPSEKKAVHKALSVEPAKNRGARGGGGKSTSANSSKAQASISESASVERETGIPSTPTASSKVWQVAVNPGQSSDGNSDSGRSSTRSSLDSKGSRRSGFNSDGGSRRQGEEMGTQMSSVTEKETATASSIIIDGPGPLHLQENPFVSSGSSSSSSGSFSTRGSISGRTGFNREEIGVEMRTQTSTVTVTEKERATASSIVDGPGPLNLQENPFLDRLL